MGCADKHISAGFGDPGMLCQCLKGFRKVFDHSEGIGDIEHAAVEGKQSRIPGNSESRDAFFKLGDQVHEVKIRFYIILLQQADHPPPPHPDFQYFFGFFCDSEEGGKHLRLVGMDLFAQIDITPDCWMSPVFMVDG